MKSDKNFTSESFTTSDVIKWQRDSGNSWREFLRVPSLSMGVYHIPVGTNDRESHDPHDRDEVYIVSTGKGKLTAGGKEYDAEVGVILYVKAHVEHHFHDVTEDLTVLVFFAGREDESD